MLNRITHIYVLSDGEKYYVGKADNVERRYNHHMSRAFNPKSTSYRNRSAKWIRSYGSPEEARKHLKIIRIKEVSYDEWEVRERAQIAAYRDMYGRDNVMNDSDGDHGNVIH